MFKKTKLILRAFLIIMAVIVLTASPSFAAEKPSKTNQSANTDKTESKKPIKRIDTMIAVFDLETSGNVDKYISRPLSESIRREVFKSGKWELIDRGNMDKVFSEQKFQLSGCVTGQCIVEAGQMLGVGKIVAGTVSLIGKTYYLSLTLINAETGKIEAQSEDKCKCELDDLIDSSKRLVKKLMGETIPDPQVTTKALEKPAMPDIVGKWHWSVKSIFVPDSIITINADGTCRVSNGTLCTWSFRQDGRNIVFSFSDKWTHIMTLSKDGLSMSGSDDWGTGVTGRKIKGP